MRSMIEAAKQAEIEEARRKAEMERLEREREEKRRQKELRKQQRAAIREQRRAREMEERERLCSYKSVMKDEMLEKKQIKFDKGGKMKSKKSAPPAKKHSIAMSSPLPSPSPSLPLAPHSPPVPVTEAAHSPSPPAEPAEPAEPADSGQKEIVESPLSDDGESEFPEGDSDHVDYTKIPELLDSKFEELDEDSSLRPTIINPGTTWTKKYHADLLSPSVTITLTSKEQEAERRKAFDLIDVLSKSGTLAFAQASFHVIIAATHCFDKSLTDTVVQDNVNPIEKLERSNLIVATTVHGRAAKELVKVEHLEEVRKYSEGVFLATQGDEQ
jgi:hypothetical protein